ncbi:MAG: hypothetical protein IPQ02_13290 [Saprospiraceae bacterium]|nr:hypothetical protein [Candidatus Defluviibacterium haderslevense]
MPTTRGDLTFYSLYLPQFAIPTSIKINDSLPPYNEFNKTVYRDDSKSRFLIYLECRSKAGKFNFKIDVDFYEGKNEFGAAAYKDEKTFEFYQPHTYESVLPTKVATKVITYLNQTIMTGDNYHVNQAGAVGPNANASNNTFNQQINQLPDKFNYEKLSEQLVTLKDELVKQAKLPEHYQAIGEIASAEIASKEKDGNKVVKHLLSAGKWVLDFAKQVGTDVVADVIKGQLK